MAPPGKNSPPRKNPPPLKPPAILVRQRAPWGFQGPPGEGRPPPPGVGEFFGDFPRGPPGEKERFFSPPRGGTLFGGIKFFLGNFSKVALKGLISGLTKTPYLLGLKFPPNLCASSPKKTILGASPFLKNFLKLPFGWLTPTLGEFDR